MDEILISDPSATLSQAMSKITSELNKSPIHVIYNGHASTRQISNQNLFNATDISQVTTPGAEIWLTLSCYVTFYESTHVNSLAHQLLFTGNAVNVTGAVLLSDHTSNLQMGESILDRTIHQAATIGDAIRLSEISQQNEELKINWAHLGDPTHNW